MGMFVNFPPIFANAQEVVYRNATEQLDGLMTPLMYQRLAALWTVAGLPTPTVRDRTQPISIIPNATQQFSALIPNATMFAAGVMPSTLLQTLNTLWAVAGLPEPTAPSTPLRMRYQFSLNPQALAIPMVTDQTCGLVTPLIVAMINALVDAVPTYTDVITADNPTLWWRFNDASPSAVIHDTQGFADGTELSPGNTLYQQPGLITEAGQFSQGAINNALSGVIGTFAPIAIGHFTLEWWMQTQPVQNLQNFVGVETDILDAVVVGCTAIDGSGSMETSGSITALPAGTFETGTAYFAFTYDGSRLRFFKNAVLVATSTAGPLGGSASLVALAYGAALSGNPFGGAMDEMALYSTTLTVPQLIIHYNAGLQ